MSPSLATAPSKRPAKACPIAKVADLLSDSWTMLVIRDLLAGPRRFCELERSLDGVSSRTLTIKLKKLVDKRIAAKDDATHCYAITDQGKNLGRIIDAMHKYGEKWL
jgi:DNA-binding HxlR family transcriptional regulator